MNILEQTQIHIDRKMVFERIVSKGISKMPKTLENEACFMYVISGDFKIYTADRNTEIHSHDCLLSQCGNYYYQEIKNQDNPDQIFEAIGIFFHPEILRKIFKEKDIESFKNEYIAVTIKENKALEIYKHSLNHYLRHPNEFDEELRLIKLKEILLLLSKTEEAPNVQALISALFKKREFDFKRAIETHLFDPLSLDELAFICHMSLATFKRNFSKFYKKSPAAYFREKRLEEAKRLLLSTELPVSQIPEQCGFEATSTFNRLFKQQFGLSPLEYRLNQIER
ncbi:helix-turn-helix domain-containing protein [Jiulongibacter sediminis]|uniref:HTH araC/xylS-type domain-containing protein n=1 Tax=Jiulongibacter sediminis TaxID=1605367 RepID=A0A0P7BS27_9BACT|nr:AraC family transcriptional regulator [Jiulongibacter sediminis]KPM47213.1 hypothetical protein AFM12_15535 [Jiulongibacter sediminis]TBX22771.1 hypothetical protein TK44_15545 [Jiulongibacter sediminis]